MSESNPIQTVYQIAASQGCTVVVTARNQLSLDLDNAEAGRTFLTNINECMGKLKADTEIDVDAVRGWHSKTKGFHVEITLSASMKTSQLLVIQSYLGSDQKRDFLSLMRVLRGEKNSRILFKPQAKAVYNNYTTIKNEIKTLWPTLGKL